MHYIEIYFRLILNYIIKRNLKSKHHFSNTSAYMEKILVNVIRHHFKWTHRCILKYAENFCLIGFTRTHCVFVISRQWWVCYDQLRYQTEATWYADLQSAVCVHACVKKPLDIFNLRSAVIMCKENLRGFSRIGINNYKTENRHSRVHQSSLKVFPNLTSAAKLWSPSLLNMCFYVFQLAFQFNNLSILQKRCNM